MEGNLVKKSGQRGCHKSLISDPKPGGGGAGPCPFPEAYQEWVDVTYFYLPEWEGV